MKKNTWLINQYKALEKQKAALKEATSNNVPEIYACFAKVLIEEYGNSVDEVEALFMRTQEVWNELVSNDEITNMVEWCEQTTGVCLQSGEQQEGEEE